MIDRGYSYHVNLALTGRYIREVLCLMDMSVGSIRQEMFNPFLLRVPITCSACRYDRDPDDAYERFDHLKQRWWAKEDRL